MKCCELLKKAILWILIGCIGLPMFAYALSDKAHQKIKNELEWLQEESNEQTVTVSTKTQMTTSEAPSIVSVITGEEIRNMGARNIIDVLRTVPGFEVTQVSYYHEIYIRGINSIGNEKVKIMLNGHTIPPFYGTPSQNIMDLPAGAVKKIEIIRGPGSAIYGTGALLGVINIITGQGGDEPSRIAFEGGTFNTIKPSAEFSYKDEDFKTWLYAEYFRTDGYDGIVESDFATVTPGFAPQTSRTMDSSDERSTFHANISYKDLYFSGFFLKDKPQIPINSVALTDNDDIESVYAYGEIGYAHPMSDKGHIRMKTYYDYTDYKAIIPLFPPETAQLQNMFPPQGFEKFPPGEGIIGGLGGKWSVLGAEINTDYELSSGIQLMGGISYEYLKQFDVKSYANYNQTGGLLTIDGVTYPPFPYKRFPGGVRDISDAANWTRDADRGVTAVYAQGIFDLKSLFSLEKGVKSLSLTVGGRYDNYNDVGSTANPRLGLVYAPADKIWFKALYGTAFRAPAFTEFYLDNAPVQGNPNLKPEKIKTTELQMGYHFTRNITGSITGFYDITNDLIRLGMNIDPITKKPMYENIGKINSYGIESELRAAFGKNTYAYLNVTWQNVKDTTKAKIAGTELYQDDFHPGMAPEYYGNIGVNYGFTENIIGNISVNYVGERDRTEEKIWNGTALVPKDSRDPVKARWLLNSSLTLKNLLAKGLDFQISGFNLLDNDHRDPDPDGYVLNDYPQAGRTFSGRISYSF